MLKRTAKSCGPDASTLASSLAEFKSAQPGLDKNISAGDGGKRARSPGRARRKPLKPLRAGTPGVSGGPVVTMLVCFFTFAREAAGAAGARRSPRPLLFRRAGRHAKPGRMRRGIAKPCLRTAGLFENRIGNLRQRHVPLRRAMPQPSSSAPAADTAACKPHRSEFPLLTLP